MIQDHDQYFARKIYLGKPSTSSRLSLDGPGLSDTIDDTRLCNYDEFCVEHAGLAFFGSTTWVGLVSAANCLLCQAGPEKLSLLGARGPGDWF